MRIEEEKLPVEEGKNISADQGENTSTFASAKKSVTQKCAPAKNKFRSSKARINFRIDTITFLICTISGTVLMRISHGDGAGTEFSNQKLFWWLPSDEWAHLHNLIGWISFALVAVHIVMH